MGFIGLIWLCSIPSLAIAQQKPLTVDRIFDSGEFRAAGFSVNWMPTGNRYFVKQPGASNNGDDIVLVDPRTSEQTTLISAANLIPEDGADPIDIESFQVSPDKNKVLVFNNSRRVWRYNTRGDFWVVDLVSGTVRKLGGADTEEATLMFAKFSPDSKSVA